MTTPMYSRINSSLLPVLLSLVLISCAQTQKQTGKATPGFWQPTASQHTKVSESLKNAASAGQKKSHSAKSDFFSGLTPAEIERLRMEAWNAYGSHWKAIAKRSRYVRQPLLEALKKVGAPRELQIIPVVESSYDPYAQSEMGATGLWQLMPMTAKDLRVKSDYLIDGRRDIKASTKGAGRFLLKLRKRFGNWPLAFAAYHLGPYGVQKRINRRPWKPEDGLKKIPLPPITKTYVRNILGLISLNQVGEFMFPKPFQTAIISVQTPINLDVLHKQAQIPRNQLFRFNPRLNLKHYFGGESSAISLRVTRWRVPAVKKHIPAQPAEYMTIVIREGESLSDIRKKYKTTAHKLHKLNREKPMRFTKGQMLHIPVKQLKWVRAEKNPLIKYPARLLADNSSLSL